MTVAYTVTFEVRTDQTDRFLAMLADVLDAMRHEKNFREAVLHRDPEQADRYMLYEVWADHEDVLNVQLRRDYRKAYHEALDTLLSKPREIGIWEPVRADRSGAID